MTLAHFCLSSHIDQLLRWQQAFPQGVIVPTVEQLQSSIRDESVIWVHVDDLPAGALPEVLGRLASQQEVHRLVVVSSVPTVQETAVALSSGATGYCHALATPELFRKIAAVVSNGGFWVGEEFIGQLAGSVSRALDPVVSSHLSTSLDKLSSREREVALQVQKGAANKEIAVALGISERTVKAHLGSIFQKLEIRDRLQLSLLLSQSPS